MDSPLPRKPLAKVSPIPETRSVRLTVRLTPTEHDDWRVAAQAADEELSRYFRRCARIGRRVRETRALVDAADG
jgi:hypothetical protein